MLSPVKTGGLLGMKLAAQVLKQHGINGDTELVHVNPREVAMLKMAGGSGTRNPHTGLLQFDDGGSGDGGANGGLGSGFGGLGGLSGLSGTGPGFGAADGNAAAQSSALGGLMGGFGGFGQPNSFTRAVDAMGLRNAATNPMAGITPTSAAERAQAVNNITAGLYSQMAQPNADLSSLADALGNARAGNLKGLRDAGYGTEAAALGKAYGPVNNGLTGLLAGMFKSPEMMETAMTPQRAIQQGMENGYLGVAANGDFSLTPKAYMASVAMPLSLIASGINPVVGGLLGKVATGYSLGTMPSPLGFASYANTMNNLSKAATDTGLAENTSAPSNSVPTNQGGGLLSMDPTATAARSYSSAATNSVDPVEWFIARNFR